MSVREISVGKVKRAVAYLRIASVNQDDAGASQFDLQRARCQAVAEEHGLTIVEEYCDTDSGMAPPHRRPALRRLLNELPTTLTRYIIVGDLARLSRNVRDLTAIEKRLVQADAVLLVYGEGLIHVELRRRLADLVVDYEEQRMRSFKHEGHPVEGSGE